jgi:hypothetical protein
MIFFTTFVTLIRRRPEKPERRLISPARMEGNTLFLPIGTEVDAEDYVEYRPLHSEPQLLTVIDIVRPHTPGAGHINDHIEVTCVPCKP